MKVGKLGVLTGGGDCPGLNAVIRAIVRRCMGENVEVIGLMDGWQGLLDKNYITLDDRKVSGLLHLGGTILRTSRTNVLKNDETVALAQKNFQELGLDGLITIGGEGTLTVAAKMNEKGMPIIGVPKTIDNDINETDFTFGFNTAVQIATEAIDRLHTTAESHNRVMIVEVMGRHAGWIACHAGIAGGADAILAPEYDVSVEEVCEIIERRRKRGKLFSIIVVAEGAKLNYQGKSQGVTKARVDDFGRPQLGGIGQSLANAIEEHSGFEARVTVLGHVQRGGSPTAHDRILATAYGSFAARLAFNRNWGSMPALKGNTIVAVPLFKAIEKLKTVPKEMWDFVKALQS